MKKYFNSFRLFVCICLVFGSQAWADFHIIPYPQSIKKLDYWVELPSEITIEGDTSSLGKFISSDLLASLSVSVKFSPKSQFSLKFNSQESELEDDLYVLQIDSNGVEINANSTRGRLYALQTLRQILEQYATPKNQKIKLPALIIHDFPSLHWRGSMLDIARHFLDADYIQEHIRRMSRYKLNRLHLHLTDDQAWRIELPKYPSLIEVGAKKLPGEYRSGYISSDEWQAILQTAAEYHVDIVPEIDLPGHSKALQAAIPELSCDGDAEVLLEFRVGLEGICLENPETWELSWNIVQELIKISPSPWFHIGGDEVKDPDYNKYMSYMFAKIKAADKTPIAWQEAMSADSNHSQIIQLWRRNARLEAQRALQKKLPVILSPCSFTYLDHGGSDGQPEAATWCTRNLSVEQTYEWAPEEWPGIVLGAEGALWTEYVVGPKQTDVFLWPRTASLAEVFWLPYEKRDFNFFLERLGKHYPIWKKQKWNFFHHPDL